MSGGGPAREPSRCRGHFGHDQAVDPWKLLLSKIYVPSRIVDLQTIKKPLIDNFAHKQKRQFSKTKTVVWNKPRTLPVLSPSPHLTTGYFVESQIGYSQSQSQLWFDPRARLLRTLGALFA